MTKPKRLRHWRGAVATGLLGLLASAVAVVWLTQPTLAALACPGCFGFEPLYGDIFVEPAISDSQRAQLTDALHDGEKKVADFYGDLDEAPRILVCITDICAKRLGSGGAKGVSFATVGIRLAPSGINDVIIAHERSHIELHGRVGLIRFILGAVPAWFDEGLAVIVSDDPRYLLPKGAADRCRQELAGSLPVNVEEWNRAASADHDLYARAACRVSRWIDANGGRSAVFALLAALAAGGKFDQIYHDSL